MKRKMVLGMFVALSLAIIIAVAAFVPTVAIARYGKQKAKSLTYYSYGGQVTVQLPEGVPSHPTTLIITAMHVQKQGYNVLSGPHNVFSAYIWVPERNSFIPVVAISTNPNPEHQELIKEIYNGTPLWNPTLGMLNCISVDDDVLVTQKRGDVFFCNLTEGVHISLPFPPPSGLPDLSFDLPPIAFEVRGIDSTYRESGATTLPSGYSTAADYLRKPAWVRLWIQDWTAGTGDPFKFAGVLGVSAKTTVIPPPA
jgi:hypothetical protein